MFQQDRKPTILVLGATGNTGSLVLKHLKKYSGDINVRLTSRRQSQVDLWEKANHDAVLLNLDDPSTFGPALHNVDRVFLLTGYTVDMLVQSKTFIDASYKAGVTHIVHMGVFTNWDTTDPHFVWHILVETYLKASGISWTNLHPNAFLDNFTGAYPIRDGKIGFSFGDRRVGWIALEDVAEVAAKVLVEGPTKHHGKDYWLSTESFNGFEVAEILSKAVGKEIRYEAGVPEKAEEMMKGSGIEPKYAEGVVEFMKQVYDGRMAYCATVRTDVPYLLGRKGLSVYDWGKMNKDKLQD